jgi:hypothetical protein
MFTHFDEKGKIFTEVVQKIPVRVAMQLSTQLVYGTLHIQSEKRIKEELNGPESFLALTGVDVYSFDGHEILFSAEFLAVNKAHIIWIHTEADRKTDKQP